MNPSGPALFPSRRKADKNTFAVTTDGRILPAWAYDPNSWQVLVEAA